MSAAATSRAMRLDVAGGRGKVRSRRVGGRRRWYVDFRPYGRIYSWQDPNGDPIPIPSREIANRVLEGVRVSYADTGSWERAVAQWLPRAELSVGSRWTLFVAGLEERVRTGERAASYVAEVRRYGRPGGYLDPIRDLPVTVVTYGVLEDLDRALVERELAPKTRAHVLGTVRAFLRWLRRRGEIDRVPEIPAVRVPEYQPRILAPEAQRRVLDAIPAGRSGIFLVLAYHGLLPGEAAALDVADYDAAAGVLTARRTKSRRSRQIPANDELRAWIAEHSRHRIGAFPLFVNPLSRQPGKRWTVDAMEDAWAKAARSVGIESRLYEGTKHSSATAARRAGVALDVIQEALGHADVRSTQRYARAAELAPVEVLGGRRKK